MSYKFEKIISIKCLPRWLDVSVRFLREVNPPTAEGRTLILLLDRSSVRKDAPRRNSWGGTCQVLEITWVKHLLTLHVITAVLMVKAKWRIFLLQFTGKVLPPKELLFKYCKVTFTHRRYSHKEWCTCIIISTI